MIFIAYFLALLVGVVLGLLGGGGSILTVPILVYVLDLTPVTATAYSLFIVGVSALVGAQRFFKRGDINFKVSIYFAIPSLIGVYFCRTWIVPNLPDTILFFDFFSIQKNTFILVFFGVIMLLASLSMLFSWKLSAKNRVNNFLLIALDGIIVGIITGFVGAGGGFLIIPALLFLTNVSMKEAVGTSLLIIAIKSILGFTAELSNTIDWDLLLLFTAFSILGIFIGSHYSKLINGSLLKKSFGIFVLFMAVAILIKELFL